MPEPSDLQCLRCGLILRAWEWDPSSVFILCCGEEMLELDGPPLLPPRFIDSAVPAGTFAIQGKTMPDIDRSFTWYRCPLCRHVVAMEDPAGDDPPLYCCGRVMDWHGEYIGSTQGMSVVPADQLAVIGVHPTQPARRERLTDA